MPNGFESVFYEKWGIRMNVNESSENYLETILIQVAVYPRRAGRRQVRSLQRRRGRPGRVFVMLIACCS